MQYVPYGPPLEGVPNVIVDGAGNDATVLMLSHWPGNTTPMELRADTSTEIAVNYLRSPQRDAYRRGAEAVSNNHFDVDGLMAMWAVLNPDEALRHAELLVAIGECGDFERWSGEQATKAACALNGLERLESSPVRQGLAGITDHYERAAHLYNETLPLVPKLLTDVGGFEEYWRDEYARVELGRALFAQGGAGCKEVPELDLAVFALPGDVHPMALNERTQCSRVALVIDEFHYAVRYRYESWVDYRSREVPPRVDLAPFAELLQTFEGNAGDWRFDDVGSIVPELRLRVDSERVGPSSVTPGLFVKLLAQFLRDNADNESLLWSPSLATPGAA